MIGLFLFVDSVLLVLFKLAKDYLTTTTFNKEVIKQKGIFSARQILCSDVHYIYISRDWIVLSKYKTDKKINIFKLDENMICIETIDQKSLESLIYSYCDSIVETIMIKEQKVKKN